MSKIKKYQQRRKKKERRVYYKSNNKCSNEETENRISDVIKFVLSFCKSMALVDE